MGRPKSPVIQGEFIHLRTDAETKAALVRVTERWDRRARTLGGRATQSGVVRELILREDRAGAQEEEAPPEPVRSKPAAAKRAKRRP